MLKKLLAPVAFVGGLVSSAFAAAPAEITSTAADLTDGFGTIKTLVVTVVVFGIVVGYIKLLRRK